MNQYVKVDVVAVVVMMKVHRAAAGTKMMGVVAGVSEVVSPIRHATQTKRANGRKKRVATLTK